MRIPSTLFLATQAVGFALGWMQPPGIGASLGQHAGLGQRASACVVHSKTTMSLNRREASCAVLAGLLAPLPALADSTGKFTSKRTAKNRYVPRIKVGLAAIKAGDMAALQAIAEDMITAMKLYGQAQRKGEVPDKISARLERDTEAFADAVKAGGMDDAKKAFKVYFEDLPRDGKEPFGDGQSPPPPEKIEK